MYETRLVEDDICTKCVTGLTGRYMVITAEICWLKLRLYAFLHLKHIQLQKKSKFNTLTV